MSILPPTPPHSPEAEMSLLGSMALDADQIPPVSEIIGGRQAFYLREHGEIYAAMIGVYKDTGTLDLTQLVQRLRDAEILDRLGGPEYLVEMANSTPSAVNASHYARIVADKHTLRRIILAGYAAAEMAQNSGGRPACDVAEEAVAMITEAATGSEILRDIPIAVSMAEALRRMQQGVSDVMPTGIKAIDREIGGIPKIGVTSVIGRPSHGKSTLVWEIVRRLCLHGGIAARGFSFEMPAVAIAENLLSAETNVPVRSIRRYGSGETVDQGRDLEKAIERAKGVDFALVQDLVDAEKIAAKCERYAKRGVRLVVIDYLQNLPDPPGRHDGYQAIAKSCKLVQQIAIRHKMSVVLVSQADKAAVRGNGPLGLSDAYGGKTIQDITDLGLSVVCPSKMPEDEDGTEWPDDLMHVYVVKNKYGRVPHEPMSVKVDFEKARVDDEDKKSD